MVLAALLCVGAFLYYIYFLYVVIYFVSNGKG